MAESAPIRMLALDLDGTLAIEDHQISPATRSALTELSNEGVEVVIATGRRYRTTRRVIDNLGLDLHAVCLGGALGKRPDASTFHQSAFSADGLGEIVEFSRTFGLSLVGQRDSHGHGGPDFVVDEAVPWHDQVTRYFEDNSDWSHSDNLAEYGDEILVLGIFHDESTLGGFAAELHARFPDTYETVIVPHLDTDYFYCEITQKRICKWHGLGKTAELLNTDPGSICAVGDQLNDLTMVQGAAHGVAMGNGHPELQRHADFVCGNHDEDGLLDVVDYIRRHNDAIAVS